MINSRVLGYFRQWQWQFCPYGINFFTLSRSPLKKLLKNFDFFVFLKFHHQAIDLKNCCAIPQHHANNMDRILMFSVVESYLNHLVEFRQENFHCLMKMIKTVNGWYRHQRAPPSQSIFSNFPWKKAKHAGKIFEVPNIFASK